jgi:hypothetical protein
MDGTGTSSKRRKTEGCPGRAYDLDEFKAEVVAGL